MGALHWRFRAGIISHLLTRATGRPWAGWYRATGAGWVERRSLSDDRCIRNGRWIRPKASPPPRLRMLSAHSGQLGSSGRTNWPRWNCFAACFVGRQQHRTLTWTTWFNCICAPSPRVDEEQSSNPREGNSVPRKERQWSKLYPLTCYRAP